MKNKIKQYIRKFLLNEGKHKENEYGCVMLSLDFNKTEWKDIQDNIEKEDLYEPEDETGYGKESDPHCTILYGIHSNVPDKDVTKLINNTLSVKLKLGEITSFNNDKYDVLKFDIISDELKKLNKKFSELPNSNEYPTYKPHCTIAYLKKGTSDKYIKILNKLDINKEISGSEIVYSKANNDKLKFNL